MSTKAKQLAKEIDHARCKGLWQNVPELARRYKKHSNDVALEQTVLVETALQNLVNNNINPSDSSIYSHDAPHSATMRPRLNMDQVKPFIDQLDAIATAQLLDREVVKARCYFEVGEYDLVLQSTQELVSDVHAKGYTWIMQLQALVLKAISYESMHDTVKALAAYQQMATLLEHASETTDRTLVDWAEEGLYRGSLLFLNQRHNSKITTEQVLQILRLYQKFTSSQPTHWRIHKREIISKYSLAFLSYCFKRHEYVPPPLGDNSVQMSADDFAAYRHDMFVSEMMQLYALYEKLVYGMVSFPSAGNVNTILLDLVDRMAEDLHMIGNPAPELRNYLETLTRATQRTFNSSKITRHLFNTLYLLGEFKEADHALSSYLYLVGLQSQATKDASDTGDAITLDAQGRLTPLPCPDEEVLRQLAHDAVPDLPIVVSSSSSTATANTTASATLHQRRPSTIAAHRTDDKEPVETILHVLNRGMRMYDKYVNKGVHAVELANLAKIVLEVAGIARVGNALAAQVYRNIGAAYGVLARHTVDPTQRPIHHEAAIQYLQQALQLDEHAWETHYHLGKQYADMRDISSAMSAVARCLELNTSFLPAWHLLVLLYSCPGQDNLDKALATCELGLQEAKRQQLPETDDAEDYYHLIMLKMTHTRLVELVHGSDHALSCQEDLFTMYGRLVLMDPDVDSAANGSTTSTSAAGSSSANMTTATAPAAAPNTATANLAATANGSLPAMGTSSMPSQRELVISGSLGNLAEASPGGSSVLLPNTSTASLDRLQQRKPKHHLAMLLSSRHYQQSKSTKKGTSKLKSLLQKRKSKLGMSHGNNTSRTSIQSVGYSVTSTRSLYPPDLAAGKSTWTWLRRKRMYNVLCLLWLQAAQLFLRQDRLDEALKAIEEAEKVNWTSEAQVWCLLGQVHLRLGQHEDATDAFRKGIVADALDMDCRLWLAKTYMERHQMAMAEGLLDTITQGTGWDSADAWFCLGDIYSSSQRIGQGKKCLFYALELDETQPVQPFNLLPSCT
ncbi:hypothetical protein BC940DRAFT_308128 [Gongronella butleri]|nr:hypothetical protein BC940DRAFT_308128 [Gongronella butleri]